MRTLRLGSDDQYGYAFSSILIETNGLLEIDSNPNLNSGGGGAAVVTANTIEVKSNGMISADALGFSYARGPGKPADSNHSANHGGVCGNNSKATYGSVTNPSRWGALIM